MSGASRVITSRAAAQSRAIDATPPTIVGAVGLTERGPMGTPIECLSYADYQATFGGPTVASADMDLAVLGFFGEGGRILHVVRTCHYSDVTDPSTASAAKASVTLDDRAGTPLDTLTIHAKTPGSYGNSISIQITAATGGVSGEFNLYVLRSGVAVESFYNLTMVTTAPNYVETVINSGYGTQKPSNLIEAEDEGSATAAPNDAPAIATSSAMTGGSDGLTSLADADFVGGTGSSGSTGLRALDTVEGLSLIIMPGRATSTAQNGMVTYCESVREGRCFAILDPPSGVTVAAMRTYFTSTAALKNLSELAAIYYPRIKVDNPSSSVFGTAATVTAAPSGAVAGLCARLDASKDGGAFEHPASIEFGTLRTARGIESDEVKNVSKRGLLFDDLINPIMAKGGRVYVDGARTCKSTGPFPTVGESRGVVSVQIVIAEALEPKRNQNNRPRLRNEIKLVVDGYLTRLARAECFASNVPEDAFYFDVGDALNGAAEQAAGNVNARLGLALSKPAEFINIQFGPK